MTPEAFRDAVSTLGLTEAQLVKDMGKHPTVKGKPFNFEMLKHQNITVYFILTVKKLETHAVWLRLFVSAALQSLSDIPGDIRPLFMLNEAGNLGHLQPLRAGMGLAAGMGVTIWTLWQSLAQIGEIYGAAGFNSFMSNAGFTHALAPNDPETLAYLSKRMGNRTAEVASYNTVKKGMAPTKSLSVASYPLMHPEQIAGISADKAIVWADPLRAYPIMVDAPGYWNIKGPKLDLNPYFIPPKQRWPSILH